MKDYAAKLYKSKRWQDVRNAYAARVGYLCERCLARGIYKPGEIVHHKIYISPANINKTEITLNPDNLEMLCRDCHYEEHFGPKLRYTFDAYGRVIVRESETTPPVV